MSKPYARFEWVSLAKPLDVDVAAVGLDGELVAGECKWEERPTRFVGVTCVL